VRGAACATGGTMRTPWLATITALVSVSCASKAAPSQLPVVDAQVAGGPHHHCTTAPPPAPAPYDLAIAMPYDESVRDRLSPDERAAFETARPTFVRYCVRCHASGTKKVKQSTLDRLDMTTYPFTSRHGDVSALILTVIGATGGAPSMPLVGRGCLEPADLDAIRGWADAFQRAHATAP
jgi:hypothetical protein